MSYLVRQVEPLFFGNTLEPGERVLAEVDASLVHTAGECAIHDWISLCVPMIVLLVQPEEQAWPSRLWWHERVTVESSVEEVSVRMPHLSSGADSRKRGDVSTAINSADVLSGNYGFVVGEPALIHIEGRAKLVQSVVK